MHPTVTDETALGVDGIDQRLKDGQHNIGHDFGRFAAMFYERAGHGAEAGNVGKEGNGGETAVGFAGGILV